MRRKFIIGNWKMNLAQSEASGLIVKMADELDALDGVDLGICPPYLSIGVAQPLLARTHVQLGAQDVFWEEKGAFTSRVSTSMLKDAGCALCLVGHSETRGRFGKLEVPASTVGFFAETNETVNLKIKALIAGGLRAVLCFGETLEEREAGSTDAVIAAQLAGGLAGLSTEDMSWVVLAYEPVWAIGTGKTCDTSEANRVCGVVRGWVQTTFGETIAASVQVLYGGSVKAANAADLFATSDIDGALVGGASLIPAEFIAIASAGLP